jgi:hypothetical protein
MACAAFLVQAVPEALPFLRETEEALIVEVCELGTEKEANKRLEDIGGMTRELSQASPICCLVSH